MTKTEIKKLVKTCVETLAKAKDIDLSIFDIRDNKTLNALIFDIRLEPNFGTSLCISLNMLKDENDKEELGKAIIGKIWGDIRNHLENDLDKQMRRHGLSKINIPGFNGMGGIYKPYNAPTPKITDNGDGTYTVSVSGHSANYNNIQDAVDTLTALSGLNTDDEEDYDYDEEDDDWDYDEEEDDEIDDDDDYDFNEGWEI